MWNTLGIEATNDIKAIKRAYALKLKENSPEKNPTGFQVLREAYEKALSYAEYSSFVDIKTVELTSQSDSTGFPTNSIIDAEKNTVPNEITQKELEAQRQLWMQADAYAGDFCHLLIYSHSKFKAKEVFHTFLQNDWFLAVDANYMFECCLVRRVADNIEDFSDEPLAVLIKEFNWDDVKHVLWEKDYYAMQTIWVNHQQRANITQHIKNKPESKSNNSSFLKLYIIFLIIAVLLPIIFSLSSTSSDLVNIKDYEQKHIEKEKTQENRPASSFAL